MEISKLPTVNSFSAVTTKDKLLKEDTSTIPDCPITIMPSFISDCTMNVMFLRMFHNYLTAAY